MLFINGLPVATVELKNPITGQTVENAKRQYMKDRDPRELLLSFKARCLVHFAVDTEEVWMTTKLNGINTYFCRSTRETTAAREPCWEQHLTGLRICGKKSCKKAVCWTLYRDLSICRKIKRILKSLL